MIDLINITKRFAGVAAVDGIDLTIQSGEFFTLLGPSGCGKTTLLRMIGGFETPDAGMILLDGVDVTALPPYRRPVNQVFQSYALFPHLTVAENVAFGLKMARVPNGQIRTRVTDALRLVSLTNLEQRKPSQLSGGQKQRVALARAIVNRPKVLLLDEPLAALDAKLRQAVQLELKQLQRELGITFVFVTHDQDEAMVLSDRIAMMSQGSIRQMGTPRQLYDAPATLEVACFIGHSNVLDCKVLSIDAAETQRGLRLQSLAGRVAIGREITVVIRPEAISRCPAGDAQFTATVTQVFFRGETTRHQLRTAKGQMLMAAGWPHEDLPQIGDAVHCRIDTKSIHIFDRQSS